METNESETMVVPNTPMRPPTFSDLYSKNKGNMHGSFKIKSIDYDYALPSRN